MKMKKSHKTNRSCLFAHFFGATSASDICATYSDCSVVLCLLKVFSSVCPRNPGNGGVISTPAATVESHASAVFEADTCAYQENGI